MAPERERKSLSQLIHEANKAWHGVKLHQPDWGDDSRSVALYVEMRREKLLFYLILNAYWESLEFELPAAQNGFGPWRRWIDTSLDAPHDILEWRHAPPISANSYQVALRSVVVLYALVPDTLGS
jgi:glycogen operon protein